MTSTSRCAPRGPASTRPPERRVVVYPIARTVRRPIWNCEGIDHFIGCPRRRKNRVMCARERNRPPIWGTFQQDPQVAPDSSTQAVFVTQSEGILMKYSTVFPAVLMALALSACDRPTVVSPPAAVTVPVPAPAGPTGAAGSTGPTTTASPGMSTDPSVPTATPANSTASPTSLQSKANPQGVMTKQEESMAMPRPGQAGDESSPALHPQK
jgi:hypothetical protein